MFILDEIFAVENPCHANILERSNSSLIKSFDRAR